MLQSNQDIASFSQEQQTLIKYLFDGYKNAATNLTSALYSIKTLKELYDYDEKSPQVTLAKQCIARILNLGITRQRAYMVAEYCNQRSLMSVFKNN